MNKMEILIVCIPITITTEKPFRTFQIVQASPKLLCIKMKIS